jgi:hypothetical protein
VLAAEHLFDLGSFDFMFEGVEPALEIDAHVLTLLRPFQEHAEVVNLLG